MFCLQNKKGYEIEVKRESIKFLLSVLHLNVSTIRHILTQRFCGKGLPML